VAFVSGSISFQRFFSTGKRPKEVTDAFVEALNECAFGKLAALPDDTQCGWVGPGHLFETTLEAERIAHGRFVHFALRVDQLRIPPVLLKSYVRMEEEAMMASSGREFLHRKERRRAREAAIARAEDEARSGAFRRMNSYPLLYDLESGALYLGNLSATVADRLMELFSQTFGCQISAADSESVATRYAKLAGAGRGWEDLSPFHLVRPPAQEPVDMHALAPGDLRFLGREFLTWLWYQTERESPGLRLRDCDDVVVMIEKTMRLECDFGVSGSDVISADSPATLPEARAAIHSGKQPTKMGLILGYGGAEYRFVMDGPRMTISGLTLPKPDAPSDRTAEIEARFERVVECAELVDALYELFLAKRLSSTWSKELAGMRQWAAGPPAESLLHSA
jgi:hypothetical protein